MHVSSFGSPHSLRVPGVSSPNRTLLEKSGFGPDCRLLSEMPIPSTDSAYIKQPLERESDHRMLIDADSPASSTAAASLL